MSPPDPLALVRGLALLDQGLAHLGFARAERLEIWQAAQQAMTAQAGDLGLGGWLAPGAKLELATRGREFVQAEVGWPDMAAGPSFLRVPLRPFGALAWHLDGGTWAPGWWSMMPRRLDPAAWDQAEDDRLLGLDLEAAFDVIWLNHSWEGLGWRHAAPGWVERIFARHQAAMKRGLLVALEVAEPGDPVVHVPVLAGGAKLERATVRNLKQTKTTLLVPSEAGFRAFLEHVRVQRVPRHAAMSMAFTWWGRALDDEVLP